VAFAVLLPVALLSAWIRGTVMSTNGYVAAVSPVAANPVVRAAVQDAVTTEVDAALNSAGNALPPVASKLAGPLDSVVARLAGDGISRLMASPAFQRLWVSANTFTHSQLISVLNGDSRLISATHGEVVLNLVPLINDVLHGISGQLSAMTGRAVKLPPVSGVPSDSCAARTRVIHEPSSAACGEIPLFPATALVGPRRVYRIVNIATALALFLTAGAFTGAVAAAPRRARGTLLQMAIGGTITALTARIVVSWLQSSLTAKSSPHYQAVADVLVHALTNGFFTLDMWVLLSGLALTAGTLLAGRSSRAAALRRKFARAAG
jgi:hypothetical protein